MNQSEETVVRAMFKLLDAVGITSTSINDMYDWWKNGLKQIVNYQLMELYECIFLVKNTHLFLKKMHNMLKKWIEQRKLLNTLAWGCFFIERDNNYVEIRR